MLIGCIAFVPTCSLGAMMIRRKFRLLLLLVGLAVGGAAVSLPPATVGYAATEKKPQLFGTREIRSANLSKFKKWDSALNRYAKEKPNELNKCRLTATNRCEVAKWRIFLKKIAKRSPREQLSLVNAYLNKRLYILDPQNYGKKDYWATPRQFMSRNGDCEDYAIAKYMSLLHLDFARKNMRIVVLQDLNLNVPHAILVVYLDGKALILDNQISKVVDARRVKHYKPIYSINENNWWLHRS